jgi:hypothetical protein
MFVTGYRGVGKSFLASQADLPSRIAFFDFESKGQGINSQLHFGTYRAFNQESKSALQMWDLMHDTFGKLEMGKYTVAILDNIAHMELALAAEVVRNANKYADEYGLDAQKIKRNAWGQQHAAVNALLGATCSLLHSRGVQLIVATSHIKAAWAGGQQVPNKWRIKGHDRWQELSILTLILIPGDHPPVPAAIVQKEQLGVIELDENNLTEDQIQAMLNGDDGHWMARRLPVRIPKCTFQQIRHYLSHPANLDDPAEGEELRMGEAEPFSSTLSKEQLALVTLALQHQEREEELSVAPRSLNPQSLIARAQVPQPESPQITQAKLEAQALMDEMGDLDLVREELRKSYPPPVVAAVIRGIEEAPF